MSTSGTVSATVFRTQKVYDQAFRRAKIYPQQVTAELLETAKDLLFTKLSALANRGIPLWAVQSIIVSMYEGEQTVLTPVGVADVINVNLRVQQRLEGEATASEGVAANAFDADLETACVQTVADGYIQLQLASASRATTYGILPNASGTWSFEIQGSDDGVSFTTLADYTDQAMVDGEWLWFDLEGELTYEYFRLRATDGTILNVTELVFQNTPTEVPIALINRDDYYNLPDKTFLGRPTQYWLDKQRDQLKMMIWPAPQQQFTFAQLTAQVQYYIQDVGSMTQTLDVPQRWFEHICWSLAADLCYVAKEADFSRVGQLEARAAQTYQDAWAGEVDRAPSRITPNIRGYTRG